MQEIPKEIKSLVRWLLFAFPHLRDSDSKLIFYVHAVQLGLTEVDSAGVKRILSSLTVFEYAKKCTSGELAAFETIRRRRAEFVQQEDLKASPEVEAARHANAEQMKIDLLATKKPTNGNRHWSVDAG